MKFHKLIADKLGVDAKPEPEKRPESWRDTFEQIVFAFVLALVFRTFEAEAFVIPTGSMAPTLYGRNKEMCCVECKFPLVVGASSEVTRDSGRLIPGSRIEGAICPNCYFPNDEMKEARAFNGDRILVNKFPYELGSPDRWDVFVFKYPLGPATNFIKRLIGLPGETIRLDGGDVFRLREDGTAENLRKPPEKQRLLQIPVYDEAYQSEALEQADWPRRWAGVRRNADAEISSGMWNPDDRWTFDPSKRVHTLGEATSEEVWLRYRHIVPTVDDWQRIAAGQPPRPRPRLISDMCGYNAIWGRGLGGSAEAADPSGVETGAFWTGELTVSGVVTVDEVAEGGELVLELCEGVWWYRCRIDLSRGEAVLSEVATHLSLTAEKELARAATGISGSGEYDFRFANVDDRLLLWIDDDLIEFGEAATLDRPATAPRRMPQWSDMAPVGIALRGATGSVGKLLLERDIYYRGPATESRWSLELLQEALSDPDAWWQQYQDHLQRDPSFDRVDIAIPEDGYLALGDNSPRSSDGRFWRPRQTVPEKYLVGKAFWIYWPHGQPFLNDGRGFGIVSHRTTTGGKEEDYPSYVVPFYPDVLRMRRIR